MIASAVVIAAALTMRILRWVGVWIPSGMGMTPEQIWRGMGALPKAAVIVAFVLSTGLIYRTLFEASPWQATFGKRLLNIYVTGGDGCRISLKRSFERSLGKWFFGLVGGTFISAITIIATKERKALHDFTAKTLVLKGHPVSSGALETWRVAAAFTLPFVWILGTFLATI